jgi:hypothetical protein
VRKRCRRLPVIRLRAMPPIRRNSHGSRIGRESSSSAMPIRSMP